MQIIIKEYDKRDEEQLKELFDLSYVDEGLLNIMRKSKFKFAYSAFVKDKLIGMSFGWMSSFHPNCTYFRILSNPFYTMSDVEEKLLSKVESLGTINFPLQTSIWETSINVKSIYEKNGFEEIRKTYMPILEVSDFKAELPFSSNNNHKIITLAEISLNNELMDKLARLVKRNYEKTHIVNPVVSTGPDEWKKLILADDVLLNGSYICLDAAGKDIAAYSFLHESEREDSYELGWCGYSNKQYKSLVPQLIVRHIKYSINEKVEVIIGEFDTTDSCAMYVLKTFPFAPCPTWITYQKK